MTKSISDDRSTELEAAPTDCNSDGFAGIFVLISLILLLCGWMWLKSYSFMHAPQRFGVLFHNVAGLNTNAAVNVNGVKVGSVESILLQGKDKVIVNLKINGENQLIPVGSTFDILSSGVVGAKYIEIALPQSEPGQALKALDGSSEVVGNDPVRVEVVVNKIAKEFEDFDFKEAHDRVNQHMDTFAKAADKIIVLTDKLGPAASKATDVEDKIGDLASEMRGTSKRLNKFLDNPELTSDLKEAALRVKETAISVGNTMHELNQTLADKPLRSDLLTAMDRLNQSTTHIQQSVAAVQQISGDKSLRTDIQHIVNSLNQTLDKADGMLSKPGFGTDMRGTLGDVRSTIKHFDLVARQMNAILERKHPLVHMIFGQPGSMKRANNVDDMMEDSQRQKQKSKRNLLHRVLGKPDSDKEDESSAAPSVTPPVESGASAGSAPSSEVLDKSTSPNGDN
ncbi:MAG TPA: MlaD family protein [Oculatellaceae cyanobacterium]